MPTKTDITAVFHVSTNGTAACPVCKHFIDTSTFFDAMVNHMIGHGWTVEHIGQETVYDSNHHAHQHTVAVIAQR